MVPEYQTWRRGAETLHLEKNAAGAGYHVDIQAAEHVKNEIEVRLSVSKTSTCERNMSTSLGPDKGRVVTVRSRQITRSSAELLLEVEATLTALGFSKVD